VDTNELIDRITKEWANRGLVIEGGWQAFRLTAIPKNAHEIQLREMKVAYYAGCQHLFACMMSTLDEQEEPTPEDLRRVELIHKELDRWVNELKRAREAKGN